MIDVRFFPLWVDFLRNELYFKTSDLTFCDSVHMGWELMRTLWSLEIGTAICSYGVYEQLISDEETDYCIMEYVYLEDIIVYNAKSNQK